MNNIYTYKCNETNLFNAAQEGEKLFLTHTLVQSIKNFFLAL